MEDSTVNENSNIDPKSYLDYIDKEMTLCGIITAFSLACVLFMMDKLFSTTKSETVMFTIDFKSIYFLIALGAFVVAAYLLFRQRAELAYYYGQISLETSYPGYTKKTIKNLFDKVDDWKFWYRYFYGIALIACAFIELSILIITSLYNGCTITDFLNKGPNNYFISIFILILCISVNYLNIKNYEKKF